MGWCLYLSLGMGAVLFLILLVQVIYLFKLKRRFSWMWKGKLLVVEVRAGRASLFVDGNLTDEFSGNVKCCMLKTFLEGEEVCVRIRFGLSPKAEASSSGVPLEPLTT